MSSGHPAPGSGPFSRVLANLICLLNPGKLAARGITRPIDLVLPHAAPVPVLPLPAEYLVRLQIESTQLLRRSHQTHLGAGAQGPARWQSAARLAARAARRHEARLQRRFLLILCLVSLLQLVLLSGASYYYVAEQRYREVGIRPRMWHGWWRRESRRHRRGEAGGYGPAPTPWWSGSAPRSGQLHRHRGQAGTPPGAPQCGPDWQSHGGG